MTVNEFCSNYPKHRSIASFFTLAFSFFIFSSVRSQELPSVNIVPPSPEASAVAKFGNIPVSYYTGVPQVSIPLYTVVSGEIQVPITLSYHASGIRVDEDASWVGLGFALNTGGLISRIVRGKDDFYSNYYFNNLPDFDENRNPRDMLVNGGIVEVISTVTGQSSSLDLRSQLGRNANSGQAFACDGDYGPDMEPDQFSYSAGGQNGKFILKRNREPVLVSREKIRISPPLNNDAEWTIVTKDGFLYIFSDYEDYREQDCPAPPIKTAWYLSKIVSPKKDTVFFEYLVSDTTVQQIGSVIERRTFSTDLACPNTPNEASKFLSSQFRSYRSVTLSRIRFSEGEVRFHSDRNRIDLKNARKLNAVEIYRRMPGGFELLKKFDFGYGYFDGLQETTNQIYLTNSDENSYFLKRLKLLSVTESANGDTIPAHSFEYYEGRNLTLPSKGSFARDHWGYFNGKTENATLIPRFNGSIYTLHVGALEYTGHANVDPELFKEKTFAQEFPGADREPSGEHMKAFTLKKITYPTGGQTEFLFEPHEYDEDASDLTNRSKLNLPNVATVDSVKLHKTSEPNRKYHQIDLRNLFVPKGETTASIKLKVVFVSINGLNGLQYINPGNIYVKFLSSHIDPVESQLARCPTNINYSCSCFTDNPDIPGTEIKNTCEMVLSTRVVPGIYVLETYMSDLAKPFLTLIVNHLTYDEEIKRTSSPISLAGGLRIKEIVDYDLDGSIASATTFNYRYQSDSNGDGLIENRSFGRIMSKPIYINYEKDTYYFGVSSDNADDALLDCYRFILTSESVLPLNGSASGSVVGYDKVEVLYGKKNGIPGVYGKTVVEFHNDSDKIVDYSLWRRPGLPNLPSNRNGLLKSQVEFEYRLGHFVKAREIFNNYSPPLDVRKVYGVRRYLPPAGGEIASANDNIQLFFYPAVESEWIRLISTTENVYDLHYPERSLSTRRTYAYSNEAHMQMSMETFYDSRGRSHQTVYKYPLDFPLSNDPSIRYLNRKHIVTPVVETVRSTGGNIVSAIGTRYGLHLATDTICLPKEIFLLETASPLSDFVPSPEGGTFPSCRRRASYLSYNKKGNILEYQLESDSRTTYVWGYNYSQVVAKVDNASYDQVLQALPVSEVALQQFDGDQLRSILNTLRTALPNATVSTFTYSPLVGITSQTNPGNITTYFLYDKLGRLIATRDDKGTLLREHMYQYYK